MSFEAVFFDMDGTIVDTESSHGEAFRTALRPYGHRLTDRQYQKYFTGKTDLAGLKGYLESVGGVAATDLETMLAQKIAIYLRRLAAGKLVTYPGAIKLVEHLSSREPKVPLALVTGSLRGETDMTLEALALTDCFSAVVTIGDIEHPKPHPEGYLLAASMLGVDPANCVGIEDTPNGIRAVRAAGMRCLAVTSTHPASALHEAGPSVIVDQLGPGSLDML